MAKKEFKSEKEVKELCKSDKYISITIDQYHITTARNTVTIRSQVMRMSHVDNMTLVCRTYYIYKKHTYDYDSKEFKVGEMQETFWFATKGNEDKVLEEVRKYNSTDTESCTRRIVEY